MGIDLYAIFDECKFPFEDMCMESLKWALADTDCNFLELFHDYNYNLCLLYDNRICTWSVDQVREMFDFLERLYKKKLEVTKKETDYVFKNKNFDQEDISYEEHYHKMYLKKYSLEDIRFILNYFRVIVDNKGKIRVI